MSRLLFDILFDIYLIFPNKTIIFVFLYYFIATQSGRWYIHDRRAHSGKVYLHDRPANRQRMRMGYIHDGRVNYIREFYLHDRPANRQRMRMGYTLYTQRSCELYKGIILHDRDVWNRQYTRVGATLQIDRVLFISQFWWFTNDNPWYIVYIVYKP